MVSDQRIGSSNYSYLPTSSTGSPKVSPRQIAKGMSKDELEPMDIGMDDVFRGGRGGRSTMSKIMGALRSIILWLSPVLVVVLTISMHMMRNQQKDAKDRELALIQSEANMRHSMLTWKSRIAHYETPPSKTYSGLNDVCKSLDREHLLEPVDKDKGVSNFYEFSVNHHLTDKQCDAMFPGLYKEIERSREYWSKRGGISQELLDRTQEEGQARVLIYHGRMYVKWYNEVQQGSRTLAIMNSINDAIVGSLEPIPDIEFVIQTGDTSHGGGAPWVLGRREDLLEPVLMPDYGWWSWPEPGVGSFLEVQDKCTEYETGRTWQSKIPRLFWTGALLTQQRVKMVDYMAPYEWSAVHGMSWQDPHKVILTPEEHCEYQFLAHLEGIAYSGRLKYVLQCRSVAVMHHLRFVQHFHHLFNGDWNSTDQNVVIIDNDDFHGLPQVMDKLLNEPDVAERIANTSYDFYRYWLSQPSIDCYWRKLFNMWADIQTFHPVPDEDSTSWQSFTLMRQVHWDPF